MLAFEADPAYVIAREEARRAWDQYVAMCDRRDYLDSIPDSTQHERDAAADAAEATYSVYIKLHHRFVAVRDQLRAEASYAANIEATRAREAREHAERWLAVLPTEVGDRDTTVEIHKG